MKTFTHSEIRGAILRAADRIERTPTSYNFCKMTVPNDGGCGTQACMWGWIGYELGMRDAGNEAVAFSLGLTKADSFYGVAATGHLYDFCRAIDAESVPSHLRAYADKYFPAQVAAPPPVRPESHQLVEWRHCAWQPSSMKRLTHTVTHNVQQPLRQPLRQQAEV